MQVLHYLTIFFCGIDIMIQCFIFFRYVGFWNKQVPALKYCMGLMLVSLVYSVVSVGGFLLPAGRLLEACSTALAYVSLLVNTMFILIVFTISSGTKGLLRRFRWVLLVISAFLLLFYVTNSMHGLVVAGVSKDADGFLYHIQSGNLLPVVSIYSVILSLIAVIQVFRSGVIRENHIRWLLVGATIIPALLSLLEQLVPLFGQLRISLFFTWVPVAIVSYLFFGYLTTARRMAIEAGDDIYVVYDLQGVCVDCNPTAKLFFERCCGQQYPDAQAMARLLGKEALGQVENGEFMLALGDETLHYSIRTFRLSNGINQACGTGYILKEVTEYHRRMDQLSTMATEDPLTGAKNRRYMHEAASVTLAEATRTGKAVTVLMLDLDFFKRVNDVYGHLAGDEVLKGTYRIFAQNVREGDLVFRYGGEEFMILCVGTGSEDAIHLAERIRIAVEGHVFATTEGPLQVTVSIGVYTCMAGPDCTLEKLVEKADQNLYQAKQTGRNRVMQSTG